MADVKIHAKADLKKMSAEDRTELLAKTLAALGHQKLRVRTNEDKKSDMINKLKTQVARINTFNNQPTKDEK